MSREVDRRDILKWGSVAAASGALLAACQSAKDVTIELPSRHFDHIEHVTAYDVMTASKMNEIIDRINMLTDLL